MNAPQTEHPILIVVVGPTGSGKSDFAVKLAKRLDAPIISTDSRQVYEGMRIGTAQPTEEQLRAAPHYFIADRPPTDRFTCADFEREALELLEKLFDGQRRTHPERRPRAIAVGGSGLYIDALCNGLDPLPDVDEELRRNLTDTLAREGLAPLLEQLERLDPATFGTIDRQNPARVVRALEICEGTGKPLSEQRRGRSLHHGEAVRRPFDITKIGIDLPRPELYARIDARVDAMMAEGLEAEARALLHLGGCFDFDTEGIYGSGREIFSRGERGVGVPTASEAGEKSTDSESKMPRMANSKQPLRHLPALQTVGYSELFDHLEGLYTDADGSPLPTERSLARAVELIKRNSRRYAKRQMTWFRRDPLIRWLSDPAEITTDRYADLFASLR